jgi:hypothetical protein
MRAIPPHRHNHAPSGGQGPTPRPRTQRSFLPAMVTNSHTFLPEVRVEPSRSRRLLPRGMPLPARALRCHTCSIARPGMPIAFLGGEASDWVPPAARRRCCAGSQEPVSCPHASCSSACSPFSPALPVAAGAITGMAIMPAIPPWKRSRHTSRRSAHRFREGRRALHLTDSLPAEATAFGRVTQRASERSGVLSRSVRGRRASFRTSPPGGPANTAPGGG